MELELTEKQKEYRRRLLAAIHLSPRWTDHFKHHKDDWKAVLKSAFGPSKTSSAALKIDQLRALKDWCCFSGELPVYQRRKKTAANIIQLASAGQKWMIEHLKPKVEWSAPDGYNRWLKASFGIDAVRTSAEAYKAIEGLKRMAKGAQK